MDNCILCRSSKKDDVQYGDYLKNKHFGVHTFCLYLSSGLPQSGKDDDGFLGFLERDIRKEVERISLLKCCYCNKKYANIGCCVRKCRRTFHFICGVENNATNEFHHNFASYCHLHTREEKHRPSLTETCLICYESLYAAGKTYSSVNTILTPCCCNGWFHKLCLQRFAKTAGYFFKCPLCNDVKTFREMLPKRGIFIPNRDAAWELESNAFAELHESPNECAAKQCKNKKGRKTGSESNPFIRCSTCGHVATHKQCLPYIGGQFHCVDCAYVLQKTNDGHEKYESEDEYIDVCHVSDKEDVYMIDNSIASSNGKESNVENVMEEMPCSSRSSNRQRKKNENIVKSVSNSNSGSSAGTRKRHLRNNSKELTSKSTLKRENKRKEENVEVADFETAKNLENCKISDKEESVKPTKKICSYISEGNELNSSNDDDPLDNLIKKLTQQANSNFSKRNSVSENLERCDNYDDDPLGNFFRKQKLENKNYNYNTHLRDQKSAQNALKNEMNGDTSCAVKIMGNKSICIDIDNMKKKRNQQEGSLNTSGRAERSRRKTVCSQTDHGNKNLFDVSQVSKNAAHERENQFEISCIANRTRRRKSLKMK